MKDSGMVLAKGLMILKLGKLFFSLGISNEYCDISEMSYSPTYLSFLALYSKCLRLMLLSIAPEGITTLMGMKPHFKWRSVTPRWLIKFFVTVSLPLHVAS